MELTTNNPIKVVRPDERGRINLGSLTEDISSYRVFQDEEGRLILEPLVEIPARERWVYDNPEVLATIRRGIQQSKDGQVASRDEDFSKYLDDNE